MADRPPLLVLGSSDGVVRALHGNDGTPRWEFAVGFPLRGPQLATADGRVYVATGHHHVYALGLDDGHLLWQHDLPVPSGGRPFDDAARVVAGGGMVAVNYARRDRPPFDLRRITVLDGQDGSERWVSRRPLWALALAALRRPVRRWWYTGQLGVALLAADDQGRVYVTERLDRSASHAPWERTSVLDGRNGKRLWSTWRAEAHGQLNWGSRTSCSIANGTVYTLGARISALATRHGRPRWQQPTPSNSHRRVVAGGDEVVCVAGDDVFVTYRARDGAPLWRLDTRHGSDFAGHPSSLVLQEPTVFVGKSGIPIPWGFTIEARDVRSGAVRWVWPPQDQAGQVGQVGQVGQPKQTTERPGRPGPRADLSWRFVGGDGVLYVPGAQTISAIRASDGSHLWTRPTRDGVPAVVAAPGSRQ